MQNRITNGATKKYGANRDWIAHHRPARASRAAVGRESGGADVPVCPEAPWGDSILILVRVWVAWANLFARVFPPTTAYPKYQPGQQPRFDRNTSPSREFVGSALHDCARRSEKRS